MNRRTIIAFVSLFLGLSDVVDWIVFSTDKKNENLDWQSFKTKYIQHLPSWLQPLYERPIIVTAILIAFFTFSGFVFVREKKKVFLVFGIVSFILAFWELFSLM